jgi:hypothetical protein
MSEFLIILFVIYALGVAAAFAWGVYEGETPLYVLGLAACWPLILLIWIAIIALALLEAGILRLQAFWRRRRSGR